MDADSDADADADADTDADADCLPDDGVMNLCGADAKLLAGTSIAAAGDLDLDGHDDILVGSYSALDGLVSWFVVHGPVQGQVDMSGAAARLMSEYDWWESAPGAAAGGGDVNGDGWPDLLVSDEGDGAGTVYVVLGPVSGEMSLADADVRWMGESSAELGLAAASPGDMDGDGMGELIIASPYADIAGTNSGCVYVVHGPPTAGQDLATGSDIIEGEDEFDGAGHSLACGGDVDGDGRADIAVGACSESTVASGSGAVYVFTSVPSGTSSFLGADAKLLGEAGRDYAGWDASISSDANGDGLADLLVSADGESTAGDGAGAVYLVLSPRNGTSSLADAQAKLVGESACDMAGMSASWAGDVNGDGVHDLLVGAPYADENDGAGAAYLVLGPVAGTLSLSDADLILVGEHHLDYAGMGVAGAGDLDADGLSDLLVAAPGDDTLFAEEGATYVLLGRDHFYDVWSGGGW